MDIIFFILKVQMQSKFTAHNLKWINQPKQFSVSQELIKITTEPNTDYWQRTFYGFQNDNGPILYAELSEDFTFAVKTKFKYNKLYDQCGIIIYQDSENWCKLGTQYENESIQRLGSVVTNLGYSDWATYDIPNTTNQLFYKLSRRGQDFYIEHSLDGKQFKQVRMFHMHKPIQRVRVGIFACSPLNSSFTAQFTDINIGLTEWKEYKAPQ